VRALPNAEAAPATVSGERMLKNHLPRLAGKDGITH